VFNSGPFGPAGARCAVASCGVHEPQGSGATPPHGDSLVRPPWSRRHDGRCRPTLSPSPAVLLAGAEEEVPAVFQLPGGGARALCRRPGGRRPAIRAASRTGRLRTPREGWSEPRLRGVQPRAVPGDRRGPRSRCARARDATARVSCVLSPHDGGVALSGFMTSLDGAFFDTALKAVAGFPAADDLRTHEQRVGCSGPDGPPRARPRSRRRVLRRVPPAPVGPRPLGHARRAGPALASAGPGSRRVALGSSGGPRSGRADVAQTGQEGFSAPGRA
jgi:hypothetical protein